jgi:hypothetical protein
LHLVDLKLKGLQRVVIAVWLQVHPSRHGTYDGISMHPYEVVFLKASWHVGEPFADKYASWQLKLLQGMPGTDGKFDNGMYRYAITCDPSASCTLACDGFDNHLVMTSACT